jgi:tetratricopeptide (TPR) repeat protein
MDVRRFMISLLLFGFAGGLGACLPVDAEARFFKGQEMLFENRHQEAESFFLAFAHEMGNSDLPKAKLWKARALFQVGRIDHLYLNQPRRAVSRLREAIKVQPEAPFAFEARREIAVIFHDRLMDYRTAALEFERLVHEFPDRAEVAAYQYRVAQSYFLVRDFDQSRTEARLLLEKWPKSHWASEALLLLANSYYLQGQFAEAIKAHQVLLDAGPDVPIRARSLFELGLCHQDLGHKDKAEQSFLAALKDHPRPDLVQMQLSALRKQMNKESDEAKPLSSASARAPAAKSVPAPAAKSAPAPAAKSVPAPAAKSAPAPAAKSAPAAKKPDVSATSGKAVEKTAPAPKEAPKEAPKPKKAPDPAPKAPGGDKPAEPKSP